jgi:DNA-binding CsgD family transcriptional regulator
LTEAQAERLTDITMRFLVSADLATDGSWQERGLVSQPGVPTGATLRLARHDVTVTSSTDRPVRDRTSPLRDFGDMLGALDRLPIPVFAITKDGRIRWLNLAAEKVVGDKRGAGFTQVVAPQSMAVVRDAFASKLIGARSATDYDAVLVNSDGAHIDVEICSVPVEDGAGIVGVFGAVGLKDGVRAGMQPSGELTPRQAEVLSYLSRGYKTDDMAELMGLSKETVRNHVRGLLKKLGVHSRLEAVTEAHARGLA